MPRPAAPAGCRSATDASGRDRVGTARSRLPVPVVPEIEAGCRRTRHSSRRWRPPSGQPVVRRRPRLIARICRESPSGPRGPWTAPSATAVAWWSASASGCRTFLPEWLAVRHWSRTLRGQFGELAFAAHTRHGWDEMAASGAWLRSTLQPNRPLGRHSDRAMGRSQTNRLRDSHDRGIGWVAPFTRLPQGRPPRSRAAIGKGARVRDVKRRPPPIFRGPWPGQFGAFGPCRPLVLPRTLGAGGVAP
jgi:hypothetical protein